MMFFVVNVVILNIAVNVIGSIDDALVVGVVVLLDRVLVHVVRYQAPDLVFL